MTASPSTQPASAVPFDRVLADEARALNRAPGAEASALCLSGGGVRSASFGLGVLQGLARSGLLRGFDYLSTVSGGGYIGGWLSAWRVRAAERGEPDPAADLGEGRPGEVEPAPMTRLRRLVKFLDPRTGALSVDVWTMGGTILRNLLVTWTVLLPIIAAGAMVPRLYLGVLGLPSQPELVPRGALDAWYRLDWIPIVLLIGVAATYAALELPSLGRRSRGRIAFQIWFLTPVLLVEGVCSIHRYWAWQFGEDTGIVPQVLLSAGGMVLPWLVGGALGGRLFRPWIWAAAATAGAAGRLAVWWSHRFLTSLAHDDPQLFVVVDIPISLALLFVQITLFIGLASRDMTDDDREWWARAAAWVLVWAAAWATLSAVIVLGPPALEAASTYYGIPHHAGRAGLALVALVSGAGAHHAAASWTLVPSAASQVKRLAFFLAAPVIAALVVVLASDVTAMLLSLLHDRGWLSDLPHPVGASLPEDLLVFGALAGTGVILGRVIAINRFSLHGMYRARLVRTFLGVSRSLHERAPSAFTGFDADDDLPFGRLSQVGRPLHVVNATLNLVGDHGLAMAERKACPFTVTPLHAGAADVGYRPADRYAGGISLGEALTTSGAAVNPNMGAASSPLLTFLLTVFNARLGVWLGNPGAPGRATWARPAPAIGAAPLVNELLGRTTDRNPYVNLSDGGHFDNLGLYEMIRRRCRYIVVIDAGADPSYAFADLATAVRLVRVDFGVEIDFPFGLPMGPQAAAPDRRRWALGRIGYRAVEPGIDDGVLVYVKPTILGDEPVDVANYAGAHPPFPHQPTTNQWFDDAQFESYRVLGLHTIASLTGKDVFASPRAFCDAIAGRRGA